MSVGDGEGGAEEGFTLSLQEASRKTIGLQIKSN